jgi:urease accessory protein
MSRPPRHHGYLSLDLVCDGGRTTIAHQCSHPPLQTFGLQEADGQGSAYLQILNPCGGLFEGDSAEIEVTLQRGARLYLTTQAATKIYPAEHGQVTRQHIRLRVASEAILEYLPLPLIPFARAQYVQGTEIHVEPGGICFVAEVLAPGRLARAERFAYYRLRGRVEGWVGDQLVLFEQLRLQPEQTSYAGLGMLDGKYYVATLYVLTSQVLTPLIPGWNRCLTKQYGETIGITALAYGGLVVRLLGHTGQEVLRRLDAAHRLIREKGLALPPLQIYRPFE